MLTFNLEYSVSSLVQLELELRDQLLSALNLCLLSLKFLSLACVAVLHLDKLVLNVVLLVANCICLRLDTCEILAESQNLLLLNDGVLSKSDQLCLVSVLFLL